MKVAILWHMHQPSYWDADTGAYRYPWPFLHAARHYHMMGVLARNHPEVRMTINVTPVLMEQLVDYSQDHFRDQLLDVIRKPAADLEGEEITRLLDHVFKLNQRTMVDPYPRYRELKHLVDGGGRRRVRVQEILDLQTLYLLTWCGPPLRQNPELAELFEKGKKFTEDDKAFVFSTAHEAVREVLPLYRELQDAGHVEISTTPYYHPILPLLIDCEAARSSRPDVHIDEVNFRYPSDARWHVTEALDFFETQMGKRPTGMWPSEGSVSNEALDLLASCGLTWAATDEGILARSLGHYPLDADRKYRPYRFRDRNLVVYFRDHELSDRVGFVYSGWEPVQAANDLLGRLQDIRRHLGERARDACVSIILDGENCWEYYPDGGTGFLTHLYSKIASTRGLETICMGDLKAAEVPPLTNVVPGSWIESNFDTWIGAPEKNRAWLLLSTARRKLALEAPHAEVPREFYRAEGSDWFWWLGPGHDTPYEQSYENLFRTNLIEGLKKAGLKPPELLKVATSVLPSRNFQPPTHLFTPCIDGKPGNYYDWIAAGYYRATQGSIHRSDSYLERMRFGFDLASFYLRTEGAIARLRENHPEIVIVAEFAQPRAQRLFFRNGTMDLETADGERRPASSSGALEAIFELAVPLSELGGESGDTLEFAVSVEENGGLIERLPESGYVLLNIPSEDYGLENWSV